MFKSASVASISCLHRFPKTLQRSATECISCPTKFGRCEKSVDLEVNQSFSLSAATGHILPLSPLVAMDTVVFVSGLQRLQRQGCEHFGAATDHLTLGCPACAEP